MLRYIHSIYLQDFHNHCEIYKLFMTGVCTLCRYGYTYTDSYRANAIFRPHRGMRCFTPRGHPTRIVMNSFLLILVVYQKLAVFGTETRRTFSV